ncbi:MAG: hypothetical protein ACRCZP_10805 [Phycicoccus sp.]
MTTKTAPETVTEPCWKCEGRGRIAQYRNVLGGTCFNCAGSGTVTILRRSAEARELRRTRAAADRAAQLKRQAEMLASAPDRTVEVTAALASMLPEFAAQVGPDGRCTTPEGALSVREVIAGVCSVDGAIDRYTFRASIG